MCLHELNDTELEQLIDAFKSILYADILYVLKLDEGQRLLAVAHDAGGANILRDIIISTTLDWYLCCEGPAKKILAGLGLL